MSRRESDPARRRAARVPPPGDHPPRLHPAIGAGCGRPGPGEQSAGRLRRRQGRRRRRPAPIRRGGRRRQRGQDAPGLQLAALHRQADGARLREGHRHQGRVHRGHQRQRRVLRQDRRAAQAEPEHRPRHHRADRLDGRPAHQSRLRGPARRRQVPQQGEPGRQREGRELRSGPEVQRAVALGHDRHRLQPEEDRHASSPASTTSSTPSSRARSRC